MERPLRHLALLLGLLAWAAAAADAQEAQPACDPTNLAAQITLFCMPDMPTAPCCEPVVASVELGGGVPCLCRVAAQPQLILARLNASHLLTLYTACGGLRTGGAHLAAACQGPSPAVPAIAPPPAEARRKQPVTGEAPPTPPTSEKPSPPPGEEPDAGKHRPPTPHTPSPPSPRHPPPPPPPHPVPTPGPSSPPPSSPCPPTSASDKGCNCDCALVALFLVCIAIILSLE